MKKRLNQFFFSLTVLASLCLFLYSCSATHTLTQDHRLIEDAGNGKYDNITLALQDAYSKGKFKEKDFVLYCLNQGMLHHYAGNYDSSNKYLTLAERKMEDLFTKSVSRIGSSFLLNDNILDYSGEDYEDIYLNVFKALNYIHLGEKDNAFVEINRVQNKLRRLTDKYVEYEKQVTASAKAHDRGIPPEAKMGVVKFHNSALARYLSMLLYLNEREFDNADIDRRKIKEAWITQPSIYTYDMPNFIEEPIMKDANLQILAFTGLAPAKMSSDYYVTSLQNALNITSTKPEPFTATMPWDGMKPNYHFKFGMPYMAPYISYAKRAVVEIDGSFATELELIENMESVAIQTFEIKKPLIYFKTLTRAVTKGMASAEAKKEIDEANSSSDDPNYLGAFLAKVAVDIAVDLTENADLRTSMFFPANAMASPLVVEPGFHDIKIIYLDANGSEVHSEIYKDMDIRKDQMSLIETYYLK